MMDEYGIPVLTYKYDGKLTHLFMGGLHIATIKGRPIDEGNLVDRNGELIAEIYNFYDESSLLEARS